MVSLGTTIPPGSTDVDGGRPFRSTAGLPPTTGAGIPLPFVSQGGSSLIMLFVALGLLQSVLLRHRHLEF